MVEKNISQEFRLKNTDKTRSHFIEEIEQTKLMSKKHKKIWTTLNYIEHLLILAFFFSQCFERNYEFYSRIKNLCNNCRN